MIHGSPDLGVLKLSAVCRLSLTPWHRIGIGKRESDEVDGRVSSLGAVVSVERPEVPTCHVHLLLFEHLAEEFPCKAFVLRASVTERSRPHPARR